MITALAYLVEYETEDAKTVAEYEFRALGVKAQDVNWFYDEFDRQRLGEDISEVERSNIEWAAGVRKNQPPRLYVERTLNNPEPSPELLELLSKAKSWSGVAIAHPHVWRE